MSAATPGAHRLVPAAELGAHLADGLLFVAGSPSPGVVLVDLDSPTPDPEPLAERLTEATTVLVGVATQEADGAATRLARELACTFVPAGHDEDPGGIGVADPVAAAGELADAVTRTPRAAVALVRLVRATGSLPVPDALAAESATYSMLLAGEEFRRWLAGRTPRTMPAPGADPVVVRRTGGILDVVLNRPERHNAFDRSIRDGLVDALDVALADRSITEVHLRGAGRSFCSGGDLDEFGTTGDVSTAHLVRLDRSVAARVHRCRERVVAHVHGACVGAGIEIPSFAGTVLAHPDSWFRLPELGMGLIPGAGGTVGIARRIGRWRTAYLALSGARLDVSTALRWGLVDDVDA
jgi:enoyl-CoA hydratase/carnithine racemase